MSKFTVLVEETFSHNYSIEAETADQAADMVRSMYESGVIYFDTASDVNYKGTNYEVFSSTELEADEILTPMHVETYLATIPNSKENLQKQMDENGGYVSRHFVINKDRWNEIKHALDNDEDSQDFENLVEQVIGNQWCYNSARASYVEDLQYNPDLVKILVEVQPDLTN